MNSLIPTIEQQCIIMRSELSHQQLSLTEEAYALSLDWFQKWKKSTGFYTKEMPTYDCPPINNSNLLKTTEKGQIFNSSLIENVDFIVIPITTWEIFHSWYGGGPAISFQVEYNPIQKKNVAVTRKLSITVTYKDKPFKITASPFKLFSQIKFSVCKYLKIEPNEYSIFKFVNLQKGEECPESKTLCELEVKNNDEFIIAKSVQPHQSFPKIDLQMTRSVSYSTLPNKKLHPGIFGLQNFGNSCYFNSGIQCLLHTNSLVEYIKSGKYLNDISTTNPLGTKGFLVKSFASLVTEAWRGIVPVIAPRSLFSILQDKAPFFSGFQQQDAHELILYLLDLIHEDLNRAKEKLSIESIYCDGMNENEMAEQAWKQHKFRNDSIIVDLFHGLLRSSIVCPKCKKRRVVFEPYVSLPMTIPDKRTCLSFIFIPFDINCPNILVKSPIQLPIEMHIFKKFLIQEIGYDGNIVFAIRNSSYEHTFFKSPPSIPKGSTLLVFEIPSPDKFYTLIRLNFKVKGLFNYTDRDKYLDSFLIEMPEATISWPQLQFAIDERFHYLWESSDQKVLNKEAKELYDMQKSFQKLRSDSKLVFNEKNYVFERNEKILFISNNVIDVTINGSFIDENVNHFNWSRVIRETIEHESIIKIQGPTLEKSFHEFFSKSKVLDSNNKWYCPDCKKNVCAEQKIDLWKLPSILIVQLKRFAIKKNNSSQISVGSPSMKKIETNIEYPDEIDLVPYVIGPGKDQSQKYRLFAVVHHFGKLNGGHYTTSAVVNGVKKWYYFNDNSTKESDKEAHSQSAYVLFYEKFDST